MTTTGLGGDRPGQVLPGESRLPTELVEQPAKLVRIGAMVKQLLGEVRAASLDEASRNQMRAIYAASIRELKDGVSPELCAELDRLALPFGKESTPSDAELRIAQAQLVGWLEGLFHGIQMALFLQQMGARAQLEGIRAGTPPPPQMDFPPSDGTYL
ncbi:MAG: bacterial proteasome activator family protein [Blastococcus sp.]